MADAPVATKRKVADLHAEVETIDPDQYATHKQLKALEKQLDATVARHVRRLDVSTQAPPKMVRRTMKVSFYYTFVPSTTADGNSSAVVPPSEGEQVHRTQESDGGEWTFRVEGTIMDGNTPWPTAKRFSHFFRKAILELDEQLYPGGNPIEWSSFRSGEESDGFAITRPGKKGFDTHTLRLQLLRNQSPERFVLSSDLHDALAPYLKPTYGADDSFVKADISLALWQYIKEKDLMKVDDCRIISNDAVFQRIFECAEEPMHALMGKLQKHMTPVGPVAMEFALKLDDAHKTEVCLDTKSFSVEVQADEALVLAQTTALAAITAHRKDTADELSLLEQQMADLVQRINAHTANRAWMGQFAADPATFMDKVVASQAADEQILNAASRETPAHLHDPTVYAQPWVHSTIDMVLAREP